MNLIGILMVLGAVLLAGMGIGLFHYLAQPLTEGAGTGRKRTMPLGACLGRVFMAGLLEALVLPVALWRVFGRKQKRRGRLVALANIAEGTHEGSISRFADAAITQRYLLVKKGTDDDHVDLCGTADVPLGVCTDEVATADLTTGRVNVNLLGSNKQTQLMVASEAIGAGVLVYVGALGKVATSGTQIIGVSLTAAGADDDLIEVDTAPPISATPGVAASLFDAHTVLYATSDNTPAALTVGANTVVGRGASGNIAALVRNSGVTVTPVAAAGSTVADAGQLAATGVVHITSDGATKGVKLPTGVAGMKIVVINDSATACELYAASGGTVNGLAADASVVVPASKGLLCICDSADTWTAFDLPAKATAS